MRIFYKRHKKKNMKTFKLLIIFCLTVAFAQGQTGTLPGKQLNDASFSVVTPTADMTIPAMDPAGNQYQILVGALGSGSGSGSGSSTPKNFSVIAYSGTLNINFNSTTNYVTTATGDISFTSSGVASGQEFIYKIIKNTSANINLTFPSSSWTAPSINNNATGAAKEITTTPPGFTLTGATGSIYSIYIKYLDLVPLVYLNYHANFYDPPTLLTNMVVFDSRASFVDPGLTTAETSVYHILIPAGTMKSNSIATVKFVQKRATSGESTIQFKVHAGASTTATANPIFYDFGFANNGLTRAEAEFQNNSSTSSQLCLKDYSAYPQNYSTSETSLSINTAADFYIDITVQKASAGNTGAAGLITLILSNI
jgi:hypothetical protein